MCFDDAIVGCFASDEEVIMLLSNLEVFRASEAAGQLRAVFVTRLQETSISSVYEEYCVIEDQIQRLRDVVGRN